MFQQEVYDHFRHSIVERGEKKEKEWNDLFANYKKEYPELAKQFEQAINSEFLQTGQRIFLFMKKGKACLSCFIR